MKLMSAYAAGSNNRYVRIDRHVSRSEPKVAARYEVRLADSAEQVASALRLRHRVFKIELGCNDNHASTSSRLEFDDYDFRCRHLIVVETATGETVGTYRLNTLETARSTGGFYSAHEFTIEDLPSGILENGIELGRACIALEHRNTKVLFLLWKALLDQAKQTGKRYFFGCCSVFTKDESEGVRIFHQLKRDGHFDDRLNVVPKRDRVDIDVDLTAGDVKLPALFDMYLRLGARVCGPPMVDREFGSIDFFVVFDTGNLSRKYQKIFG